MEISNFRKDTSSQIELILETPFSKEVRITLAKGEEMKKHRTAFPIIIHILEGEIDFGVDSQRIVLESGSILSLEGGIPHDLIANEDSVIRLSISKQDNINRIEKIPIIEKNLV